MFRCYFSFCLDERIRNSTVKFDCQACSGGIGRNVLNLLSIPHVFSGKTQICLFLRAVAAWAWHPGTHHPTSSLSGGHRSDEAGGFRAHECSPRTENFVHFSRPRKTTPFGKNTNCNLRHGDGSTCAEPGHAHSARTCHAGMDGSGGARCLTIVIGLIPASYERRCTSRYRFIVLQ